VTVDPEIKQIAGLRNDATHVPVGLTHEKEQMFFEIAKDINYLLLRKGSDLRDSRWREGAGFPWHFTNHGITNLMIFA